jgi:hypothetical protein
MIKNRVFILGAGFGKACGYPLASELIKELMDSDKIENDEKEDINSFLTSFFPAYNVKYNNFPNVEDALSLLDAFMKIWSDDEAIKSTKRCLLTGLCNYLSEPPRYKEPVETFAKNLTEGDFVITFNWDNSLEEAIRENYKSYRYSLKPSKEFKEREIRGKAISLLQKTPETRATVIPISKPHGSINWISKEEIKISGIEESYFIPLDNDLPKEQMSIFEIKTEHCRKPKLKKKMLPYIIPPSIYKNYPIEPEIRRIWDDMVEALGQSKEIWFIGYSLPLADLQARIFIYLGIYSAREKYKDLKIKVINPDETVIHRYNSMLGYGKFEYHPAFFDGNLETYKH